VVKVVAWLMRYFLIFFVINLPRQRKCEIVFVKFVCVYRLSPRSIWAFSRLTPRVSVGKTNNNSASTDQERENSESKRRKRERGRERKVRFCFTFLFYASSSSFSFLPNTL